MYIVVSDGFDVASSHQNVVRGIFAVTNVTVTREKDANVRRESPGVHDCGQLSKLETSGNKTPLS